jgi:predicted ester cyclase
MSNLESNKAIVGRWFTEVWGETCNLAVVDEIAAPDMLLQYSLHEPRRGRDDIKAFMTDFRRAFPDLNFWGTADLIAEGDYVVGRWEGGGTHTGIAFGDFLAGSLPANTGRRMRFTGTTVLKVKDGKIVEEVGLDDGVTALTQLGLLKAAA